MSTDQLVEDGPRHGATTGRPASGPRDRGRARLAGFVAVCVACVAASVGYLVHARQRAARVSAGVVDPQGTAATLASLRAGPHVFFRNMDMASGAGHAAVASPDAPDGSRAVLDMECMRVHFAGGHGLCLTDKGDLFTPYNVIFLGPDLEPLHKESLAGLISRARVSPDGRYGAATVFVTGHSYADGAFSTQTTLYDMKTGELLGDLEHFEVTKDGKRIESPDFNFWGVTFAEEPGRFYATLGTGGHHYLVRGDISTERVKVLRDGVECPSLSPDNTRMAFKQRVDSGMGTFKWRPAVLDLGTLGDHLLAESRNVDDQLEWLDNDTVLYSIDTGRGAPDTWSTRADGTDEPRLFLRDADSPAVVGR